MGSWGSEDTADTLRASKIVSKTPENVVDLYLELNESLFNVVYIKNRLNFGIFLIF